MISFGDELYSIINNTKSWLFSQGELAQLTYQAFDAYAGQINKSKVDKIKISYPVGYTPQRQTILSEYDCSKSKLVQKYSYLRLTQLPINGIYQLVTLIEAMFGDILRAIIIKHPKKIGSKKNIIAANVLNFNSIEEIKYFIADSILNELSYKSPKEFSYEFNKYTSINMIESPLYHQYIELKATRDIYIHNKGVANEIYLSKSGSHARVKLSELLPVDVQYFLESYECCLQICELLVEKLHVIWPSSQYELDKSKNKGKST